jgi:hypothetical protein
VSQNSLKNAETSDILIPPFNRKNYFMTKVLMAVVGVAVVGAGAWYLLQGGTEKVSVTGQTDGHVTGETETGTWNDLLGMATPMECSTGMKTDGVENVGTVFVSGGNMRGDFSSTVNGKTVDSHIIAKADGIYTWSSGMPQGVKMPRPTATAPAPANSTQSFDPNTELNYSCKAWVADNSKFTPPTDITFMDVAAMMGAGMTP